MLLASCPRRTKRFMYYSAASSTCLNHLPCCFAASVKCFASVGKLYNDVSCSRQPSQPCSCPTEQPFTTTSIQVHNLYSCFAGSVQCFASVGKFDNDASCSRQLTLYHHTSTQLYSTIDIVDLVGATSLIDYSNVMLGSIGNFRAIAR